MGADEDEAGDVELVEPEFIDFVEVVPLGVAEFCVFPPPAA
jgi:hypothetical protein